MSRPLEQHKFLLTLAQFPKFGPIRLRKLINFFPSLETAFNASVKNFMEAGIEENIAQEFTIFRAQLIPDQIIEHLMAEKIKVVTLEDAHYPKLLKEIYAPPPLLYYKGELENEEEFNIAVVGTRKFSSYGRLATEKITRDLTRNGLTIISGLALGIDALAHAAALEMGGRTMAVLGSGLDRQSIYPSANRYLADKITASGGAVLSEFPIGTPPLRHNFPQRNRIVSGISLGVLVIEAGERSGALITAKCALEQNREVFALPGSIFSPMSIGSNNLIREGAHAITSADDVIETLNLSQAANFIETKKTIPESPEEELVCRQLNEDPKHINELARETKLDIKILNSTLIIMEMKGLIKNMGNMTYVIIR